MEDRADHRAICRFMARRCPLRSDDRRLSHRLNEPMTLGLLSLVVIGGIVVVALVIAGVLYCVKQIAKW
jgi:hypothetical protein